MFAFDERMLAYRVKRSLGWPVPHAMWRIAVCIRRTFSVLQCRQDGIGQCIAVGLHHIEPAVAPRVLEPGSKLVLSRFYF